MTKARENSDYTGLAADIVAGDTAARAGRKNLILNGSMQISQRGASHATTGYGSLDRFQLNLSGGSCTMSQESLALGETAVPANINKFLRLTTTSGNDNLGFLQHIEGVDTYEGVVTFSLYAKGTNPAGGNLNIQVSQNFGTGGSPSSVVALTEQTLTVTGTWTKYDFQFTLPSLTGKTKGTAGDDYIAIFIRQPDVATGAWTADFTGVQLELGSVATDFEHRSYGEELQLCKRYCQELCDGVATETPIGNLNYYNTTALYGTIQLPVEMRASPTGTIADGTLFYVFSNSAGPATLSLAVGAVSSKCIELIATTSARTSGASAFLRTNGNAAASILLTSEL